MNCQSDNHIDGDLLDERTQSVRDDMKDSLQLQTANDERSSSPRSVNNDDKPKKGRGRPSKPSAKDEKGNYICQVKWHKKRYEENREEMIAKNKVNSKINQDKYRECYHILKELVIHYKMEIPDPIQERVSKVISI
jgi:hypothetical protein